MMRLHCPLLKILKHVCTTFWVKRSEANYICKLYSKPRIATYVMPILLVVMKLLQNSVYAKIPEVLRSRVSTVEPKLSILHVPESGVLKPDDVDDVGLLMSQPAVKLKVLSASDRQLGKNCGRHGDAEAGKWEEDVRVVMLCGDVKETAASTVCC